MTGSVTELPLKSAIVIDFGHFADTGAENFFISWVDEDGTEMCVNDAPDYLVAAHKAKEAADDFEVNRIVERFRLNGGGSA